MTDGRLSRDDSLVAFRGAAWSLCELQKEHHCTECRKAIPEYAKAYRPLRERAGVGRYERLCCDCAPTFKRSDDCEPDSDGRRLLLVRSVPEATAQHFAELYGGTAVADGDEWNVEQGRAP